MNKGGGQIVYYLKKIGASVPKRNCGIYVECSYVNGYIYLKYLDMPSGDKSLEQISEEEYNANVPILQPEPVPLTEQEQAILDTAVNAEYLVCLADLGL